MKAFSAILLSFVFLLIGIPTYSQSATVRSLNWMEEKIAPGVYWKKALPENLFGNPQSLNLIEINLRKRKARIVGEAKKLIGTSVFGQRANAIAAVNGGFFNMREGGSVTILKINDRMVTQQNESKNQEVINAAIAITVGGEFIIGQAMPTEWYRTNPNYRDVLVTGPLLIYEGIAQQLGPRSFNDNRHPRTCACIKENGKLLLLTADGRNENAAGLSLDELTSLLKSLKCKNAINLDGGGSTTLWIAGKPDNGIVNYPSDNKNFDHAGERPVANAIIVY